MTFVGGSQSKHDRIRQTPADKRYAHRQAARRQSRWNCESRLASEVEWCAEWRPTIERDRLACHRAGRIASKGEGGASHRRGHEDVVPLERWRHLLPPIV